MSFLRQKLFSGPARTGAFLFLVAFVVSACTAIQKPNTEPFYAETAPPPKQEFRWSNGKAPASFDPARAAAAPETDVVRALFEGLTEIDAQTLKEIPAAADRWASSDDMRVWTFHLRKDARWSNGERVTADDFVTSWKRLATLGDKAAHRDLFQNIVGLQSPKPAKTPAGEPTDFVQQPVPNNELHIPPSNTASAIRAQGLSSSSSPPSNPKTVGGDIAAAKPTPTKFGVEATDDSTLTVTLELPDKDFPRLVANPIFRPVYGDGVEFETDPLDAGVVTNGAFKVASAGKDGIALDRSETYWNRSAVSLEHVRFVPKDSAEAALDAYKNGDLDAVTNVEFEPLALKLLAPYDDFRQTTHSALNFYEFNLKNPPFSDRRIREALAISIDRERLTDGELEGAARPATSFLPLGDQKHAELSLDVGRAKQLLDAAGFAGGAGFPKIRLLINRNDTQQRVARAVAKMWKQNLNLDTEIIVKDMSEMEAARSLGEYDLLRRGVVLPTVDESVGMAAIFGITKKPEAKSPVSPKEPEKADAAPVEGVTQKPVEKSRSNPQTADEQAKLVPAATGIGSEEDAVFELNAIPLYFPMSYSLVKPYVRGFEINGIDAPTLKDISIDSGWQPKAPRGES